MTHEDILLIAKRMIEERGGSRIDDEEELLRFAVVLGNRVAAITALRAALAQQAEPETCTWQQDGDSESGLYATSCRRYFSLDDGTPEDNRLAWCCYCGKRLVQELITEDEDE